MRSMDATYPEITEDEEEDSGGFSAGALGVIILLVAVPVLLALVLTTARGNANPAPTPTVLQQATLIFEEIKAVAFPPEAVEYSAVDADTPSEIDPTPHGSEPVYGVSETLEIDFLTPRGSEPVYDVSETLEITVDLSQSAYLYCYYQDGAGTIARVFPNRFQPDAFVEVGQPVTIPGRDMPFRIVFELPGVLEIVSCIAADVDVGKSLLALSTPDLMPMPVNSLEQVAAALANNAQTDISQAYLRIVVN